jgi:hypothetical protein
MSSENSKADPYKNDYKTKKQQIKKKGKKLNTNSQSSPRLKLRPRLDSLRRLPPDLPRFLR